MLKNVAGQGFSVALQQKNGEPFDGVAGDVVVRVISGPSSDSAGAGTLTKVRTGALWYAPTQGETNHSSVSFYFSAPGDTDEEECPPQARHFNPATLELDEVIEGGYTARQLLRGFAAVLLGRVSGAGTGSITITGIDGSTTRVESVGTGGNRQAITLDLG